MRDAFVGILAVVGILLFTYKITERNRDNLLSVVAGIAAVGVAIFPTGIPPGVDARPTPLQDRLGERPTAVVHYACAAVFIVCLGFLCYGFAERERWRPQKRAGYDARFRPGFWYGFHLAMAIAIGGAVAFIAVTQVLGVFDEHSLLVGETAVTVAFGLSWLLKGLELQALPKMASF